MVETLTVLTDLNEETLHMLEVVHLYSTVYSVPFTSGDGESDSHMNVDMSTTGEYSLVV